jgi:hypothetical protein
VEPVRPLDLKGKSEPVPAYRLVAVTDVPARPSGSELVGRTDELRRLRRAFDTAVAERRCEVATVLGPAGIGKSRLAKALAAEVAEDADVWVGRCMSYGEGITYAPLREIFHQAGSDRELAEALLLGTREEAARAARSYLEGRARDRPVVLVLEDLHWAEPTLLDLLEGVAVLSRHVPILIVALARPELLERRPDWAEAAPHATVVALEGLTIPQSEELLAGIGSDAIDEAIRERVIEVAEGNPLFLEELLMVAAARRPGDLTMPDSIQAVLTARIEGLDPGEQRVAELASVAGKAFRRDAVLEIGRDVTGGDLRDPLTSLERKHLIVAVATSGAGDEDAEFRHQLIRDAAYVRLPKAERADLHERLADWLEARLRAGLENDEVIGYHLERSYLLLRELDPEEPSLPGLAARAAHLLARAGERAFARSDVSAASNLLGRAVDLLPRGDPLRIRLLPDLGAALGATGDLHGADARLTLAVEEARGSGSRATEAHADAEHFLLRLSVESDIGGTQATEEGRRLLTLLDGSGEDRTLAKAWNLIGVGAMYATRFRELEEAMRRMLEHAERAGDLQQRSTAVEWLAIAIARGPTRVSAGIEELERWRTVVAEGSEADAGLLVTIGVLRGMGGEREEARRSIARGRGMLHELGSEVMCAAFAMELSDAERYGGDATPAIPELRRACDVLDRFGERNFYSTAALYLARSLAEAGEGEAEDWVRRGEDAAVADDIPSQVALRASRAEIAARRGDTASAQRLAREAVALTEPSDDPVSLGVELVGLARILERTGDAVESRALAARALGLFELKGAIILAEDARALLT